MKLKERILNFFAPVIACFWVFAKNKRAESEIFAPVTILIGGIIWAITIPIFVTQIQDTNTTSWSFTGYAGAIVLYGLMPFAMIAGSVIWILKKVL